MTLRTQWSTTCSCPSVQTHFAPTGCFARLLNGQVVSGFLKTSQLRIEISYLQAGTKTTPCLLVSPKHAGFRQLVCNYGNAKVEWLNGSLSEPVCGGLNLRIRVEGQTSSNFAGIELGRVNLLADRRAKVVSHEMTALGLIGIVDRR